MNNRGGVVPGMKEGGLYPLLGMLKWVRLVDPYPAVEKDNCPGRLGIETWLDIIINTINKIRTDLLLS